MTRAEIYCSYSDHLLVKKCHPQAQYSMLGWKPIAKNKFRLTLNGSLSYEKCYISPKKYLTYCFKERDMSHPFNPMTSCLFSPFYPHLNGMTWHQKLKLFTAIRRSPFVRKKGFDGTSKNVFIELFMSSSSVV